MRRYRVPALLLLVLLVIVLLASQNDRDSDQDDLRADPEAEGDPLPDALLARSEPKDEQGNAPGLEARSSAAHADTVPEHGPVTVQVLGPDGKPLDGVFVAQGSVGDGKRVPAGTLVEPIVTTLAVDAQGEVVFRDLPYDGSHAVVAYTRDRVDPDREVLLPAAGCSSLVPILGERVVYRAGVGHWLDLHVVDADRGTPVPAARATMRSPIWEPAGAGDSFRHRLMLAHGKKTTLALSVKAPEGWVAWERSTWPIHISPYAKRLTARYPLRREVPVVLSVLEPDRHPVKAVEVSRLQVAGDTMAKPVFDMDAYGRLRLRGIPHLPGEILSVRVKRAAGVTSKTVNARLGNDPRAPLFIEIVLPAEQPGAFGIRGSGGRFSGRSGRHDLRFGGHSRNPPRGSVTVYVRRRGGGPAAGAHVWLGKRTALTDANGRAHFRRVHPGTYKVLARQLGLLPLAGSVTVRGSEAARITLTEGTGGQVQIHVVDEEGRPLPYATLQVVPKSGGIWVDLDEKGTQRLDPFTDHTGRRLLRHIEPGEVTVKASWGSRNGQNQIGVIEDGSESIRIVLPRPKAP